MRSTIPVLLVVIAFSVPAVVQAERWTLQLEVRGQRVEGTPLNWSDEFVFLLGRDGRLWKFTYSEARNHRKIASDFRGYSYPEMRSQLKREFGRGMDVTGSANYLVVHQAGRRNDWSERFEQMYRSFARYFSARGFELRQPTFPLVAVVFASQNDFLRHAANSGARIGPGVLGYYSPITNRILLYDRTAQHRDPASWPRNAETIIHEAAHQCAFNTGIHDRFAPLPRWIGEGLGTMFEAPGVWESSRHPRLDQRINRDRLERFREFVAARRSTGNLAVMVSSDRAFQTGPADAYAEAWALTFYLAEVQPANYVRYLGVTSSRPRFVEYRSADRLRDFTSVFGADLGRLEMNFLRYIQSLK